MPQLYSRRTQWQASTRLIIIGNLGRDPEIKYTQSNVPVANFSVATTESWKDKTSGEWQEKTEWHRIVAWRHLAERAERYLKKGKQVYIEGRSRPASGPARTATTATPPRSSRKQLMLLGRRDEGEGGASSGGGGFAKEQSGPKASGAFDRAGYACWWRWRG